MWYWNHYYHWPVLALLLLIGFITTGNLVKAKKINWGQTILVPLIIGLIYISGVLRHLSWWQWLLTLVVSGLGLWRLFSVLVPKSWNARTDALTGKDLNKAGLHWPGLIGCLVFHGSLLWWIWHTSAWSWLPGIMGAGVGYLMSCFYNPNLRERWVVIFFKKPRYGLPDLSKIRYTDSNEKESEALNEEERYFEQMIRREMGLKPSWLWNRLMLNRRWMDEGLNLILIPSWFPGFDIAELFCEELEINGPKGTALKTEFIPTRPELLDVDENGKATVGTEPGPPIQIAYKLTVMRHDPRPFLRLADEDRSDDAKFQGLIARYVEGALTEYTRQLTNNEAKVKNPYLGNVADINRKRETQIEQQVRKELLTEITSKPYVAPEGGPAEDPRLTNFHQLVEERQQSLLTEIDMVDLSREGRTYETFPQYLAEDLRRHTGVRLVRFQIMDVNQSPDIEAAQKALRVAETKIQTAVKYARARAEQGKGEGDFIVRQVEAIYQSLDLGDKAEAMRLLTALRLAESGGTVAFPAGFLDGISKYIGSRT
ncbi:MAG: hypothetical protein C3F02_01140 [Parcubacteria group bacterium]|nr:MAG: hypothetical protein C3F02_01140 [Parcubacteria group bacterium]